MDAFIFIRRIRFLFDNDIGMESHEIFIVEGNMPDDAKTISNNAKFKDIAEMSVNVQLFDFRIGSCMGRHGTVSGLIRVITFIKALGFGISFQLSDNPVGVFGIIFGNKSLNTGRIKNRHISPGRINRLAYGFGKIVSAQTWVP